MKKNKKFFVYFFKKINLFIDKMCGGIKPDRNHTIFKLLDAISQAIDLKDIEDVKVIHHLSSSEILIIYKDKSFKSIIL